MVHESSDDRGLLRRQLGSNNNRSQFWSVIDLLNIDQRTQSAEPRLIASPARNGTTINRLPRLPLTWGLHRPRIRFGAQARVVPSQAAGRNDPPDKWLRRAGQLLVINLDEAISGQHTPPMIGKPLVVAKIRDQFGASGRKCQARMEMRLMDRQCRIDCCAPAMDDDSARQRQMNYPGPEKVERHLVGHSRCLWRYRTQQVE